MNVLRVLIIDDVYIMRNLIRKILEESGHEVVGEAKDGKEGVKLFKELQPDLVTLDINMPVMNGIETIKQLREINHQVPVLTITGERNRQIHQQMIDFGSYHIVRKPFQPAYLLSQIEDLMPLPVSFNGDELVDVEEVINVEKKEGHQPVLVINDDEIEDSFDEEFDILSEAIKLPDPNLLIVNDQDSIVIPSEIDFSEQRDEEFLVSNEGKKEQYALRTPDFTKTSSDFTDTVQDTMEDVVEEEESIVMEKVETSFNIDPYAPVPPPIEQRGMASMSESLKKLRQANTSNEELMINNSEEIEHETQGNTISLWASLKKIFKK